MKVHLTSHGYLRNFGSYVETLDLTNPSNLMITTDDRWIYVHPAVLTMLAALGLRAGKGNVSIDKITARSGHYLEAMGLFDMLKLQSQYAHITKHEAAGRFIPLTQVRTQDDQSRFVRDLIPLLHLEPNQADAIRYTVGELVRNVLEHAQASDGAIVAAQYSKSANAVRIGICDTGIGIKESMRATWPGRSQTDLDAIQWALAPGVSGTTLSESGTEQNAGAGLFFTKSIALLSRDYFVIYSGSGLYRLLKRRLDVRKVTLHADPTKDNHASSSVAPYFPGTLVAVDISLDALGEFADVLEQIRAAYGLAIRERRRNRYKRPQFTHSKGGM